MRNKILIAAVVAVVGFAGLSLAATITNRIGQVFTVDSNGVTTLVSDSFAGPSGYRTVAPALGAQISTNVTVNPAVYPPRDVGDLLIGTVSGRVYIAVGSTNQVGASTNGWVQLK